MLKYPIRSQQKNQLFFLNIFLCKISSLSYFHTFDNALPWMSFSQGKSHRSSFHCHMCGKNFKTKCNKYKHLKNFLDFFCFLVRVLDISNNFYKTKNLHYQPVIPVNPLLRIILKAISPFQLHKRLTKTHLYAFFESNSFSAYQNTLKQFIDYMLPGTHSHIIFLEL